MPSLATSVVIEDAEKIADELCPPVAAVPRVLGALIQHVNQLAKSSTGKELEALAEDVLGIAPPPAPEQTAEVSADPAVQAKLAELQAEIDALKVAQGG